MQSAVLYDRLERALIALEYALADARSAQGPEQGAVARSQEALQGAGEELQEVLGALRALALHDAAVRVREWA